MTKAIFVLTSQSRMGDTDRQTGFYFDEMAIPYWALADAGIDIDIASINGGNPPADPNSLARDGHPIAEVDRFRADPAAMAKLTGSKKIDDVKAADYQIVFLPGGHGTMWDFAQSKALGTLIGEIYDQGGIVGAVCHGPTGLLGARKADGTPLVDGKRVNGFTNSEEERVGLEAVIPYFTETELIKQGGLFEKADPFTPHAVRDGRLITGQNPMSSARVAALLLEALAERH